jgi:hypothetical protein
MNPDVDKVLRRVLIIVAIADVILFLNTSRPESLTSFSYDPVVLIFCYGFLLASQGVLVVIGVRALRRSRRGTTPSETSAPKAP